MAVTPPTRGQQDWDDEMNNALQSLDAAAQSAAANASEAVSTANTARDIAQSVHTAVIGTADAATAGFINTPDSETATALSATYVSAVVLTGAGVDLTGATDSTAALQALYTNGIAAGKRRFVGVPGATYKVVVDSGAALFTVTTDGVTFDLAESSIDNSATSYTADTHASMWLIDGADDTTVLLRHYLGFTLPTPEEHLGYRGATLVRAINGANGVRVEARATNLRYGVQTGEYGDASKGQCKNFDVKLRGSMIGYPIAAYYADGIRHDIDVDGIHRVAYIAGCDDTRGVARWRDQYIADTAYLITDCLTSGTDDAAQADPTGAATTSRGCSNVDVESIDKGSTTFQTSTRCAGITLSRVDPCAFRNISVKVHSRGTDTVSTKVGAWVVASDAKAAQTRYPYNWESQIVLENVRVSGLIDHSAATLAGNSGSEFYMVTHEGGNSHAATVRDFYVDGLTILPSSAANPRASMFETYDGLSSPARFRNFHTPGMGLKVVTSATVETIIEQATGTALDISGVSGGSRVTLGEGARFDSRVCNVDIRNTVQRGGLIGGVGPIIRTTEKTVTLTGASVTWSSAVLAGAIILGVQGRVQTDITGATGYTVGITGDTSKYVSTNTLTAGSTFGPANASVAGATPHPAQASVSLLITPKTADFTGGTLRLVVSYIEMPAPTA